MAMAWLMGLGLALASVVWVELVRDYYHALAHVWTPLYRLHGWHHRVFRSDLSVVSTEIYQKAHWYNDVPEALVMLTLGIWPPLLTWVWQGIDHWPFILAASAGMIYTLGFLLSAIARGLGIPQADEITDLTHRPGPFLAPPAPWRVNRTYHWRHHFDDPNAYFCGTLTLVDKMLGTALSLKGKKIAVTGASGGFGQALLQELHQQGAKAIAITSCGQEITVAGAGQTIPIRTEQWCIGQEEQLKDLLVEIDILVINHGVNVHQRRDGQAIQEAYEVNTFSALRLMELFLATVKTNRDIATKEIWVNTSEAEVNPAFSPLYELSKRALGDVITLKRLDSPCVIRKLILGPFKSKLNPVGVMGAAWVARQVVNGVKRDSRNIIVTINPITFIAFPIKELFVSLYFRCFSKKS
ncbi:MULTISPECIES: bifunctional sterol desaturase/short chain dehydrogenase [unclassified Synechocystis]|uniref:bifunctional sterol desaturase/short chain dehydrogenase n=1 Tax=unclassified Synechocystis TaxID=2640012 RepID=UPI00042A062B|nr:MULTISPECIES: bifunctional sterol desaturase/short chain dehydrogenase [unclassified Synechocystis]AIE72629.1 bifunctional sterol desaturase/short chain dehydrogenase [Synechocystis sp. PCC 6714]MCT0254705.1 bifunctional sterol desaturase/short chain dehydrogenase [Synechocystis sp. CS-94]